MPNQIVQNSSVRKCGGNLREDTFVVLLIAATVFLAHFLRFRAYGLYEDDYWSIARCFDMTWKDLMDQASYCMKYWPTGRPLNHLLPASFAFAGVRLGGVEAMYLIASLGLTLNSFLVYLLARRCWLPFLPALATALVYVLFPADTTRQLLIHVSHVQGAMTFLFLALLLWLQGGWLRWLAYPLASLCLMSYETAFLPFLAVPLLRLGEEPRINWRSWILHGVACGLVLAIIGIIRMRIGDSRASEAMGKPMESIWRCVSSLFLGPATGFRAFGNAFIEGLRFITPWIVLQAGVLLACLGYLLFKQKGTSPHDSSLPKQATLWLAGAAGLTWAGSYALTLVNYPPTQIVGRFTSTHVAAAWPASLFFGCLIHLATLHGNRLLRGGVLSALSLCFALLLSYAAHIQGEYVKAWDVQKDFWRQVLSQAPDTEADCAIIVNGSVSPLFTPVIAANSWADYHACSHLFGGNFNGKAPQFGHLGVLGPLLGLKKAESGFEWRPQFWTQETIHIDPTKLILFNSTLGVLQRVPSINTPAGKLESTRPIPPAQPHAQPRSKLFKQLLH
jgi:hypothetical protein